MVATLSCVHARVVSLLAALAVGAALPSVAVAQTPAPRLPGFSEEPPPWEGEEDPDGSEPGGEDPGGDGGSDGGEPAGNGEGGESEPSGTDGGPAGSTDDALAAGELPRTGSEPLLLAFSGAALALLGTGLRLRTLDADVF